MSLEDFVQRGQSAQRAADEAITQALCTELAAKRDPMHLVVPAAAALQLTALVQLALRHPAVTPALREEAALFVTTVRGYFEDCPIVRDVIRRGDDPREDR